MTWPGRRGGIEALGVCAGALVALGAALAAGSAR